MDLDELRTILSKSRADVWMLIDAAIDVASLDYGDEMKDRRDGIIERLYASSSAPSLRRNRDVDNGQPEGVVAAKSSVQRDDDLEFKVEGSPSTPHSIKNDDDDEEEGDPYASLFDDDEQTQILRIKEELEDPHQSEDSVVELLQTLADMDITFKGLQETDIGRHVNRLRKHPSNDVRILVKQLVRKWKDLVDDWVVRNPPELTSASTLIADGDSPQQNRRNSFPNDPHPRQVPHFGYSPNPQNGGSGSERNNSEPEQKPKSVPRRESTPIKSTHSFSGSASAPPNRPHKESIIDPARLASARKRLQENYKEAQNAKKQRKIQVMDIHEIPKPKNGFISKNKGGFHGRNHR